MTREAEKKVDTMVQLLGQLVEQGKEQTARRSILLDPHARPAQAGDRDQGVQRPADQGAPPHQQPQQPTPSPSAPASQGQAAEANRRLLALQEPVPPATRKTFGQHLWALGAATFGHSNAQRQKALSDFQRDTAHLGRGEKVRGLLRGGKVPAPRFRTPLDDALWQARAGAAEARPGRRRAELGRLPAPLPMDEPLDFGDEQAEAQARAKQAHRRGANPGRWHEAGPLGRPEQILPSSLDPVPAAAGGGAPRTLNSPPRLSPAIDPHLMAQIEEENALKADQAAKHARTTRPPGGQAREAGWAVSAPADPDPARTAARQYRGRPAARRGPPEVSASGAVLRHLSPPPGTTGPDRRQRRQAAQQGPPAPAPGGAGREGQGVFGMTQALEAEQRAQGEQTEAIQENTEELKAVRKALEERNRQQPEQQASAAPAGLTGARSPASGAAGANLRIGVSPGLTNQGSPVGRIGNVGMGTSAGGAPPAPGR